MKNIIPVQIWSNGTSKQASVLLARIVSDDLSTHCSFYYELKEADIVEPSLEEGAMSTTIYGMRLADGNVFMDGTDYQQWDGSNETAYQFIATKLNLTLVTE